MSRQSVIDRLQGANTRLQAALVAGEDTLPHRNLIERLKSDIAALNAEENRAKSAAIAKFANDQGELAASISQNADAGIAATLARHPAPTYQPLHSDHMTNPAIIAAAKVLAAAEAKHQAAAQIYGESTSRTAAVQSRLNDIETAGISIREQRHSGLIADREAAGMIALNHEDQADLRKLLAVAEHEQNSFVPSAEPVRQAQEALNHAIRVATFDALAQRAKEAEAAFLAVVADVYAAGRSIGRSSMLGASWVPSKELHYMVSAGEPPVAPRPETRCFSEKI